MLAVQFGTITTSDIQPGFVFKADKLSSNGNDTVYVVKERSGSERIIPVVNAKVGEQCLNALSSQPKRVRTFLPYKADVYVRPAADVPYYEFKRTSDSPVGWTVGSTNPYYSPVNVKIIEGKKLFIEG